MEIVNLLGHKYCELGRYEEAAEEHREAIQACTKIKKEIVAKECQAVSHRALGECYSEMGNHEQALDEHNLYLILALQLNDMIEIQRAHATIGRTYLLWSQDTQSADPNTLATLNKSQKSFQKALHLCER